MDNIEDAATTTTPPAAAPVAPNLFGDSDDDDDEEVEADLATTAVEQPPRDKEDPASSTDAAPDKEDAKEEEQIAAAALVVPHVTFPAHDAANHPLYYTKLPNLIGMATEAFHPDTYDIEEDEGEAQQYNMIRWRYANDDSQTTRESNTRLVEWDDGSYTLHVGPAECLTVEFLDARGGSGESSFAGGNGYLYLSQNAAYDDNDGSNQNNTSTVLECLGGISRRLVLRPISLQSEAHKSLTYRNKTLGKVARIASTVTQEDPELVQRQRTQVRRDLATAQQRQRNQNPRGPRSRPRRSREYLEEEDDEDYDTTHLKDMKRRVLRKDRDDDDDDMDDYGDDDEDDEEEDTTFRKVQSKKKKRGTKEDSDDDVFINDEEDDEEVPAAHLKKKRLHQAVIDDDDDDSE